MVSVRRSALHRTSALTAWWLLLIAFVAAMALPAHAVTTWTLLQYRDISDIRGKDGEHLAVNIEFAPAQRKRNVARSDVDAAVAATLIRRCPS